MDEAVARDLLGRAGWSVPDAPALRIEAREERWLVELPCNLIAWFPIGQAGVRRLARERRILDALATHCSFRAPRVIYADVAGWQVRERVQGRVDPWGLYGRIRADPDAADRIGRALGGILAEQHASAPATGLADVLPSRLPWPETEETVLCALAETIADPALLQAAARAMHRYGELEDEVCDRVLVHGDLGLHNIAVAEGTDTVTGVFDYDGAAWADRHQDFRYLVFADPDGEEALLDGALYAYEAATGLRLDRCRIRLCNAACAVGFLAFRRGTPPDVRSCGRTLAEDLAWVRQALAGVGLLEALA